MKKSKWAEKIRAYALKNAIEHEGKALEGSVISSLFHEGLEKDEVKEIIFDVKKSVKEINSLSFEEQREEYKKLKGKVSKRKEREGLSPLPGAKKGKVIMRFAPSPSGPLHVGHAATGCISFLYVRKYGGKFYMRIEDTNPDNIYKPAYKMLKEDAGWLFDNKARIIIQSERMPLYYKYIDKLIKLGKAYVCSCEQEKFKNYANEKKNCPCRSLKLKEQEARWKKMLDKRGYEQGQAAVRFKSGMNLKNPAFRDFPLARINLTKHALQGDKYRVWPLMNFAVAVDDIEMKMTHIIRAKEHRDNAEKQKMLFSALKKKFPWTAFLGRWHFKNLELSTTKMRKAIEKGEYRGWDDERLPTIASLRKQGYNREALWKVSEQVGLSETDKIIEKEEYFRLLRQFNK
ncbi:MAG: glutamate--tRNA ligase family protein [Nanoarchaeota archaeon]